MNDIDAAIAAAREPERVEMVQRGARVTTTGRPFVVSVPVDLTDEEALAVCGFVSQLPTALRRERTKTRLLLPRPM